MPLTQAIERPLIQINGRCGDLSNTVVTAAIEAANRSMYMQHELQITWRGMDHSAAIEDHIRMKLARLEKVSPGIMSCRVAVEAPHKHKHQGNLYKVNMDLRVPHGEVVVNRHEHEDVYVALRDAFVAARRQLADLMQRQRSKVKTQEAQ